MLNISVYQLNPSEQEKERLQVIGKKNATQPGWVQLYPNWPVERQVLVPLVTNACWFWRTVVVFTSIQKFISAQHISSKSVTQHDQHIVMQFGSIPLPGPSGWWWLVKAFLSKLYNRYIYIVTIVYRLIPEMGQTQYIISIYLQKKVTLSLSVSLSLSICI